MPWDPNEPGVVELPSGRWVRGRGLRRAMPAVPDPTFGVYLTSMRPPDVRWDSAWIRWPDFWLPLDRVAARRALVQAWRLADSGRVEVACPGGRGRTGTALACIAILDGVDAHEAVQFVRARYDRHAVETPWQRRYVEGFDAADGDSAVRESRRSP